jgi:hypothetical protein
MVNLVNKNNEMKKLITIILMLMAINCYPQLQLETVYDTTRADGQRFIITYPYEVKINLQDSLSIPKGDSVLKYVYPYYSKLNSTVSLKCQKKRIVLGLTTKDKEENTRITYEWVTISFAELGKAPEAFMMGLMMKKALKPKLKPLVLYKLSQE